MTLISILDFVRITHETDARRALDNARDLAQHAEGWGFSRFWVAEHHNYPGIAGAATAVVLSHIAAGTKDIRVGAGGVMMPNHAPIVVAEQFGTLAHLFPNRIDLGLGRASGSDQRTVRALRRPMTFNGDLRADVVELQDYFGPVGLSNGVLAVPSRGTRIPLWILGSSLYGAQLAADLGLRYAFASHFAPDALLPALYAYRSGFKPSGQEARPHAMIGVNIVAAETDDEARRLATTQQMTYSDLVRGTPGVSKPPIEDIDTYWSRTEKAQVSRMLARSIIGSPRTVKDGIAALVAETGADELIIDSDLYDHAKRLRSFEIIADVIRSLGTETSQKQDLRKQTAQ